MFRPLAVVLLVAVSHFAAGMGFAASPEDAFAALDRDGEYYPPFYVSYIAPHGVIENGVLWCAYQDGQGRPLVMRFDLATEQWDGPVRASDFGLGEDTHGNPSICIDNKGYLHVFFGCHGRAMKHIRSTKPYDIRAWEEMSSPTDRATYPQTMRMADGSILLFYRAGGHMEPWSMRVSKDDCATWSEAEKVIEMRLAPKDPKAAAYCAFEPGADRKTVHCFYVHKDDNPTRVEPHPWRPLKYPGLHEAVYRYNMYYVHRDAEGVWRAGDGTELPLPLSKADADRLARLVDSGDEFASSDRIVIDAENRPYLRYSIGVNDWKTGRVIVPAKRYYAGLADGKWTIEREPPKAWPEEVRRLLPTSGARPFGTASPCPWMIDRLEAPSNAGTAGYVTLRHIDRGYMPREGGPAWPPKDGE